jgi:1,4-dihydroxy-2-naphthoate polyprenyltransferase
MPTVNRGIDATSKAPSQPTRLQIWLQAIAFRSFTASTIPVMVGSLLALVDHRFSLSLCILMLLASVACHAGSNLANDYFDYKKGVDNPDVTRVSKVILRGHLTGAQVKRGTIVAFTIATFLGFIVVYETSWKILALALASLAAAYFYTGGPKPLGYIALGEVVVFIFMGPIMVGGAYFAMANRLTTPVMLVACAVGCLVAAIMHANNIRDIETDRAAGKTTIAQLSGRPLVNQEYLLLIAGGFVLVLALVALDRGFWPLLAVLFAGPTAMRLVSTARTAKGTPALNGLLRKTAGLHLRFGALLILGLLLRALLNQR